MDPRPISTPSDIEAAAKKAGLSMAEVCRRAGVAQSTFNRWKNGTTQPTLGIYQRLCGAVAAPCPPPTQAAA
jgi:transcriptional regulator with XRE-family HTH domain